MEIIRFHDHMKEENRISLDELPKYHQCVVEACGEVVHEDKIRVVLTSTKWADNNDKETIADTWFICKGAIISRKKVH